MKDMQESDTAWDGPRNAEYARLNMDHMRLEQTHKFAKDAKEAYAAQEPTAVAKNKKSPLNRWLWSGDNGLEADEIKQFLSDPDPDQVGEIEANNGIPSTVFRIKAETRSDINTGAGAAGRAVDEEWSPDVIERLAYYGDVERMCTSFMTSSVVATTT